MGGFIVILHQVDTGIIVISLREKADKGIAPVKQWYEAAIERFNKAEL